MFMYMMCSNSCNNDRFVMYMTSQILSLFDIIHAVIMIDMFMYITNCDVHEHYSLSLLQHV